MKTHDLSNDSDDKEDNDSVHTDVSEDPEGAQIVKQATKAAQQSKSAGKSKADSHPADPRTMMCLRIQRKVARRNPNLEK